MLFWRGGERTSTKRMYDGASRSEPGLLQRAVGDLRVGVKRFGAASVLDDLRQAGCLKARFPRPVVPGGIAGGARLDVAVTIAPDARGTVATQAAERVYRARASDVPSSIRTRLAV